MRTIVSSLIVLPKTNLALREYKYGFRDLPKICSLTYKTTLVNCDLIIGWSSTWSNKIHMFHQFNELRVYVIILISIVNRNSVTDIEFKHTSKSVETTLIHHTAMS